ncbi:TetR/AcrR family transcriptional regulator [Terrabacter sp. LjRoot27]|uniref:TetR/AcrR family transcriptional regulator n=1 Tax=Terrabacter sp. LjRoot27 TaxID=3342306 RepID=UPI003ECE915B
MNSTERPERRPDPRVERTHEVVKREALAELASRGYGAFTIESVAKRSGVAKSTIYRHWPGKLALVADALETLNVQPPGDATLVPTSALDRVDQLLRHLSGAFADPAITGCTPALIEAAEHDRDVRAFHHAYAATRRRALVQAIADGVADGTFPARVDPDTAAIALAGAIVYCRVMTDAPFRPGDVPTLIETVLGVTADQPGALAPQDPRDGADAAQP